MGSLPLLEPFWNKQQELYFLVDSIQNTRKKTGKGCDIFKQNIHKLMAVVHEFSRPFRFSFCDSKKMLDCFLLQDMLKTAIQSFMALINGVR